MAPKRKIAETANENGAEAAEIDENPAKSVRVTRSKAVKVPAPAKSAPPSRSTASSKSKAVKGTTKATTTRATAKSSGKRKTKAVEEADEDEEEDEGGGEVADAERAQIEAKVEKWTVAELKVQLGEKNLSTNGVRKVLVQRLVDRLVKEKDPSYKPRVLGRWCKWCGAQMKKRFGFKGPFYGCSAFPTCQYTTSLSGYAKPDRERLKGIAATGGGGLRGPEEYEARYESYLNRGARKEERYYNKLMR